MSRVTPDVMALACREARRRDHLRVASVRLRHVLREVFTRRVVFFLSVYRHALDTVYLQDVALSVSQRIRRALRRADEPDVERTARLVQCNYRLLRLRDETRDSLLHLHEDYADLVPVALLRFLGCVLSSSPRRLPDQDLASVFVDLDVAPASVPEEDREAGARQTEERETSPSRGLQIDEVYPLVDVDRLLSSSLQDDAAASNVGGARAGDVSERARTLVSLSDVTISG